MSSPSTPSPQRWLEGIFLLYTPVWTAACALVMWSGVFKRWDDRAHLGFGLALALPLWLLPGLCRSERGVPFAARYTVRATLFIALFSFLQNYFGSPLFFRCFGLSYHFAVTWTGNGSPWFLSFMTVAYFSTYFALMQLGLRRVDALVGHAALGPLRLGLRAAACVLLGSAMAFAETLGMANKWLAGYFAYADKTRMLLYGSLCYGSLLALALPLYVGLGDPEASKRPLSAVLWQILGANMLVLILYELYAGPLLRCGP
jgi:cycloeucalenol cycloisomerase